MKLKLISLASAAAIALPTLAHAENIGEFLTAFHKDPAKMMERLPSVVDKQGVAHPQGFIGERARTRTMQERMRLRAKLRGTLPEEAALPLSNDLVENFVEPGTPLDRQISSQQAYNNVSAPIPPYADSYWPTYLGQIAYRYADKGTSNSKDWSTNFAYAEANPASAIVAGANPTLINQLSPAEKYDYVIGDSSYTLTHFAWAQGKKSTDDDGGVATWMGICHGWAGASSMGVPFIGQPATVLSSTGVPVTFYPQDIKALQDMLWANAAPRSRFIGGRCTVTKPARNANGRVIDPNCFDTNPATWHLAVTNQLGKNRRGFVFDGTYDAEVWNFPIVSAKFRYFNPQTFEDTPSWVSAQVPLDSFRVDKFREFRGKDSKSVVGVYMDVTYVIEIIPGVSRVFDAPTKTVRYIYDLELDASNNIVGGEWYSNAHPDFIWTFPVGAQAMAFDESPLLAEPWTSAAPVPASWADLAHKASARGAPLYTFLQKLIDSTGAVHQPVAP